MHFVISLIFIIACLFQPIHKSYGTIDTRFLNNGLDQASLHSAHIKDTNTYFEKHLKSEGKYNAEKISSYISHLEKMRDEIKSDIYETTLFEKLELDVKKFKKSQKKARQKSDANQGSEILHGFEHFILPTMYKLLNHVNQNAQEDILDGILADFVRGFVTYYMPDGYRSFWPGDADGLQIGAKALLPYWFRKEDKHKIEASNLQVGEVFEARISNCLNISVDKDHFLSNIEILKLKECGFDISLLNPGISAFWMPPQNPIQVNEAYSSIPLESERIYYRKVSLRSKSSPKIKAYFKRDKKKHNIKIKFGHEVHTDLFASKIAEMIGFSADEQVYKNRVKVYFEKGDSFEEYRSALANKYGIESIARFTIANGKDEHGEWMLLEDTMVEGRPDHELRLAPFDIMSWGLLNRREYRSFIMFAAWIGLHDVQPTNFKQLFQKMDDGTLFPLHRMHDLGASFGGRLDLKQPKNPFGWAEFYKANHFHSSFLKTSPRKDSFFLNWNDWSNRRGNFKHTTYNDAVWMIRKILTYCTEEKLLEAAEFSGMPSAVGKLFVHKLLMRQNEMIHATQLEKEFASHPLEALKYLHIEDEQGEVLKKGKIVRRSFPGQNTPVQLNKNWWTSIPGLITFDLPVAKWGNHSYASTQVRGKGFQGIQLGAGIGGKHANESKYRLPIGIGVQLIFTRRVRPNTHYLNTEDQVRLYQIEDQVKIQVGADSPLLEHLIKKVSPLSGGGQIKFYEKSIRHIHYTDHVKAGYASAFRIPKIASNIHKFATEELKPLELVRHFDKVGIEFTADAGVYSAKPVFENGVGIGLTYINMNSVHYARDEYGQMHVYDDNANTDLHRFHLSIAYLNLGVVNAPLFKFAHYNESFNNQVKDYILNKEDKCRYHDQSESGSQNTENELEWLKKIEIYQNNQQKPKPEEYTFSVDASGKKHGKSFGAGFIFNREKFTSESKFRVKSPSGDLDNFYRFEIAYAKYTGWNGGLNQDIPTLDILVNHRTSNKLTLEMELAEKKDFVITIRSEDFFKSRSQEKVNLLIQSLNQRYSQNDETPFYRDFTLPPLEEVTKYPKVYAVTHVFVQGNKSIQKIKSIDQHQFIESLDEYFSKKKSKRFKLNPFKKHRIKKLFRKLKNLSETAEKNLEDRQKFGKTFVKLLYDLETDHYGLHMLKEISGTDGVFVMGQIYGLLRSFSSLGDLQQLQRRRFMAKSWGSYDARPVLQRFMRHQRLVRPVAFIEKLYSDIDIFGSLETAINPNFDLPYSHDRQF